MAAATADHVALPEAPEGTCVPMLTRAHSWWVKGSTGWYAVNADTGECGCQSYQFRRKCKHAEALRVVLTAQKQLAEVSPLTIERAKRQMTDDELKAVFA